MKCPSYTGVSLVIVLGLGRRVVPVGAPIPPSRGKVGAPIPPPASRENGQVGAPIPLELSYL